MTTEIAKKIVEDGDVDLPDENDIYDVSVDIVRNEIAAERVAAKAAGLLWTPWRKKRKFERWSWCCDDYHRANHKRREIGIFISYATEAHTMVLLCERCLKRDPLQMPNKHWMRRYLNSGHYTRPEHKVWTT